jgi:hypothetical protein
MKQRWDTIGDLAGDRIGRLQGDYVKPGTGIRRLHFEAHERGLYVTALGGEKFSVSTFGDRGGKIILRSGSFDEASKVIREYRQ